MNSSELKDFILAHGASDVGFFECDDGPMKYGITIVVRLSEQIIEEISDSPTLTYFNHYRQINSLIDRILLETGLYLQNNGFKYYTIAASQSMNDKGWNYEGRYSHKKGACLAGLGSIGKNSLFIHKDFGSLVRLGTIFTDFVPNVGKPLDYSLCDGCDICVKACPSGAITGEMYYVGIPRDKIFDAELCSEYMKKNFQKIGRGSVCGICMRVCPKNKLKERDT